MVALRSTGGRSGQRKSVRNFRASALPISAGFKGQEARQPACLPPASQRPAGQPPSLRFRPTHTTRDGKRARSSQIRTRPTHYTLPLSTFDSVGGAGEEPMPRRRMHHRHEARIQVLPCAHGGPAGWQILRRRRICAVRCTNKHNCGCVTFNIFSFVLEGII